MLNNGSLLFALIPFVGSSLYITPTNVVQSYVVLSLSFGCYTNDYCNGNGICNIDTCVCNNGWTGTSCNQIVPTPSPTPIPIPSTKIPFQTNSTSMQTPAVIAAGKLLKKLKKKFFFALFGFSNFFHYNFVDD